MTSMYAEISSALVKPTMFYNQILTYAKYDDYERTYVSYMARYRAC